MSFKKKKDKEIAQFNSRYFAWIPLKEAWSYCTLNEPVYEYKTGEYYLVLGFYPGNGTLFLVPAKVSEQKPSKKKGILFTLVECSDETTDMDLDEFCAEYAICMNSKLVDEIWSEKKAVTEHIPMFVAFEGGTHAGA